MNTRKTSLSFLRMAIFIACMAVEGLGQNEAAQEHAERAVEFVRKGDLKSAEDELRKAIAVSPSDPALLTSLGGVLGMEGDLQHATPYLAKAVELDPKDPALRRNLAANEWQLGKFAEARGNLERLLRTNREDKSAIFLLGMVSAAEGDYTRSATLLESVPEAMEREPQGWVALASDYYHTRRPEQGLAALRNVLSGAQNPDVTLAGAKVAMDANDFATAESLLRSIRAKYADSAAVDFQIALAQCRDKRTEECKATLDESIKTGHAGPDAYVLLCTVLAEEGHTVSALDLAGEAAEKFPAAYKVFLRKASIEMKLQYYSKAVDSSRRACNLHNSPDTMAELARAEWRTGMRKAAAARFEQILAQNPRDAAVRETYGSLLLDDGALETRRHAIELLKQALLLDHSSEEALYQLANVELDEGRPQQALEYLQQAVKQRPQDGRVHYALSRVYDHLGRSADAASELESYAKLRNEQR